MLLSCIFILEIQNAYTHWSRDFTFSSRFKSHMITFSRAGAIALSSYLLFTRLSVTSTLHFLLHNTPKQSAATYLKYCLVSGIQSKLARAKLNDESYCRLGQNLTCASRKINLFLRGAYNRVRGGYPRM